MTRPSRQLLEALDFIQAELCEFRQIQLDTGSGHEWDRNLKHLEAAESRILCAFREVQRLERAELVEDVRRRGVVVR